MKRKLSQRIVIAAASFLAVTLFGHQAYCSFEDARTLPAGIARLSFVYAQTSDITQTFDGGGNRESLTQAYNVALDAQTIQSAYKQAKPLVDALNAMPYKYNASQRNTAYHGVTASNEAGEGQPLGDALSAGFLNTGADINEKAYNISLQVGATDRLSVGFLVPIVNIQANLNASLDGTNTAQDIQAFLKQSASQGSLAANMQQLASANVPTLRSMLGQLGYNVPTETNHSGIGDISFGGRYNYYKSNSEKVVSSVQAFASAPTGAPGDPTTPTEIPLGNGAWSLSVGQIFNYSPFSFVTLSNGIHFTHFLPAKQNHIVNDMNNPSLLPPASNEESLGMQLGDRYSVDLGANFKVTQALSMSAGIQWWWQRQSQFSGSDTNVDYSGIDFQTNEYTQTAQFGAQLSSISAFKRHEFPLPMDVALNVYIPTAGRNATITPYGTAEVALYF